MAAEDEINRRSVQAAVRSGLMLEAIWQSRTFRCFRDGPFLLELQTELKMKLQKAAGLMLSELAETHVPVEYALKPVFQPRPSVNRGRYNRRMLPFSDALSKVQASSPHGPTYYISGLPLALFPTSLAEQVSTFASNFHTPPVESLLFIGGLNSGTFLHYDLTHNLLVGIAGEKEVQLVDPGGAAGITPYAAIHHCRRYASLTVDERGLARLPTGAKSLTARVGPGQALGIPAHWWHQIRNVDLAISVSLAWQRPWYEMLAWADLRCYVGDLAGKSKLAADGALQKLKDYRKSFW